VSFSRQGVDVVVGMDHGKEIRAICAIAVQQADLGHRDGNHERVVPFAGVSQVVHDERLNALSLLDSQSYVERVVWFGENIRIFSLCAADGFC
jgi:hypothetical protein